MSDETSTLFACGDVSGTYFLNSKDYSPPLLDSISTGVIIITDIVTSEFSTLLLITDNLVYNFATLTKIQIIDKDTTLILGTTNSTSLQVTINNDNILPITLIDNNSGEFSFILTIMTTDEDKDSIDIKFTPLNNITPDFSAEEKFQYVTDSRNESTSLVTLSSPIGDKELFSSLNLINSVDMVNQTLVVISETSTGNTSLSFIDVSNNISYPIITILYEDDKFSIGDISTTVEDDKIIIYFFGNYKTGANIQFSSGPTCNFTNFETENKYDHVYVAKYIIDQSLDIIDCRYISDNSSRIDITGVSFSISSGVALLGNFQEFEGGKGEPIIQFGTDGKCEKPTLSEVDPTNFIVIFNRDTLECIEIGTFESVVTEKGLSYPVIGTNVVMHGQKPIIMFYNPSITVENKNVSMGILYLIIPLGLPPPVYQSSSSVVSTGTSIIQIDESSSSHPRHSVNSIFDESSEEEEVGIPWYSSLIVIFLLAGAVIGTVVLYNVYTKYKRTKNNVETRKHRFSRVSNDEDDDNNL